uniref:Carbohydrate kinase PfkB domain-containing protein n=1 Tax=Clastoptera arizonana TaxID=38151 RepID=A0A1B6D9V0_9HEMI
MKPKLVSAVGDDLSGKFLLTETLEHVDCQGVMRNKEKATARYTALIDNKGDFLMGIGDMDIHDSIVPGYVEHFLTDCPMVLFDGNIPLKSIQLILEFCQDKKIPVMFEPTDVAKAAVPFQTDLWKTLNIISPNLKELMTIASFLGYPVNDSLHENNLNAVLQEVVRLSVPLAVHIQTVLVTLGPLGIVVVGRQTPEDDISARYYSANLVDNVVSASGAGDW